MTTTHVEHPAHEHTHDPGGDHITPMLDRSPPRSRTCSPRFTLDEGDVIVLDNYRCWNGRDAHTGERVTYIQTLRTDDAR